MIEANSLMKVKETVFLNGKFVPGAKAGLRVMEPGFLQGWGVFETMRSYNGRVLFLDWHIARLIKGWRKIAIPCIYSSARLKAVIKSVVLRNNLKDAYVRITLWKKDAGSHMFVFTKRYKPHVRQIYNSGLKACISRIRVDEHSFLAGVKTTSRAQYELASREAKMNRDPR